MEASDQFHMRVDDFVAYWKIFMPDSDATHTHTQTDKICDNGIIILQQKKTAHATIYSQYVGRKWTQRS